VKQEIFERRYTGRWEEFERWSEVLDKGRRAAVSTSERREIGREFPARYRQICHHLSLARARRYSFGLQQRLNRLALEGHRHLYRARTPVLSSVLLFIAAGFPRAFRRHGRFILFAALIFILPGAGMSIALTLDPDLIYSLVDPAQVAEMESMYDPANRSLGRERQSDTDLAMFGYYIANNVGIGFRTFAGGLLFGLGSMFFLGFNGLFLAAVATHLTTAGFASTFWPFVSGHSAFELTAIVIFGGAGLMIGMAGLAPGRKKRWHAIRDRARDALPLVYGGGGMLLLAAFVEAFWSSTTWPPVPFKFAVGGALWVLTLLYFWLAGRHES
jgi:uncharacterized membrane protein SpoIIM required for sporulation